MICTFCSSVDFTFNGQVCIKTIFLPIEKRYKCMTQSNAHSQKYVYKIRVTNERAIEQTCKRSYGDCFYCLCFMVCTSSRTHARAHTHNIFVIILFSGFLVARCLYFIYVSEMIFFIFMSFDGTYIYICVRVFVGECKFRFGMLAYFYA